MERLTTAQAADLLGYSERTLQRWRTHAPPLGPPVYRSPHSSRSRVEYDRAEVIAYCAEVLRVDGERHTDYWRGPG